MTDQEFIDAVNLRQTLTASKKELEDRVKSLTDDITAHLIVNDLIKVAVGDWNVTYTERKTKTIKPELLLSRGVSPEVIAESTQVTVSQGVTIRKRGE